jgi:translin
LTQEMVERARRYLDAREEVREQVLEASRKVVRNSARAMAALHRKDQPTVQDTLKKAEEGIKLLAEVVERNPYLEAYGPISAAYREFAEVELTRAFVDGQEFPGPEELGVPYKPYLAALGDAVGELRRHALDLIRADEVAEAEQTLKRMEEIFDLLMEFDYPNSILPGVRHKRDVARSILEETRGDVTTALRQRKLEEALKRAERKLEG